MTDKAARIFALLLSNDRAPLTVKKITGILEMSERTVGTYLKEVYSFCREEGIEVINKPGVGILVNAGSRKNELLQSMALPENIYYSSEYRVNYIIELLLNNWTTYTIALFADDLNASKTTIEGDLRAAEKWLDGYHIRVVKKVGAGICLAGEELDIRRAIVAINRKFYKAADRTPEKPLDYRLSLETYRRLCGCYKNCDVQRYVEIIQHADRNARRDLTDSGFETLLEYLIVMEKRISAGFVMQPGQLGALPDDRPNMADYLEVYIQEMNLPEGEAEFLWMIVCCLEYQNSATRRDELFAEAQPHILHFTRRLVGYLSNIIGLDFTGDELLLKTLYMFERSSLVRVKYGIDLQNPFREEIKKTYPAIFSACSAAGGLYERAVGGYPTENEIASLSLLVGGAVVRSDKKVSAVIVCAAGIGTAQIVARKIEERVPGIQVIATLSFRELEELDRITPMLVITTISAVETDYPTVRISPIVSEEDVRRIGRACSDLYTKAAGTEERVTLLDILRDELIFLDVEGKSKEKLLRSIADEMCACGYVESSFYEDVIRREQVGATALGQGVAIPHGVSSIVKRPAIALVRLSRSIDWGGEPVDLIFLLALNFSDVQYTKAFFKAFYQLTSNANTLALLRAARSKEEIKKIIADHCY